MRQLKTISFVMARANTAKSFSQKIDDHWKFKIKFNRNNLRNRHDR